MPEGDVVWRTAGQLRAALAGQVLTRSDFRVPRFATVDLAGRLMIDCVSRGKHILSRVEGGYTIHTHLRMEGAWRIWPAARPLPSGDVVRLVLATQQRQAVGFKLGIVELLRTADEDRLLGHLGPDLLGPDWDLDEAVRRLAAGPERTIGEALLDQRNLAGVGTIYRAETLFLTGVSPWRVVRDVGNLADVVKLAQRLLAANSARGGIVTTGDTRRGQDKWVYGRTGRPCRRCGSPIVRGEQGGEPYERIIFWCPNCQR